MTHYTAIYSNHRRFLSVIQLSLSVRAWAEHSTHSLRLPLNDMHLRITYLIQLTQMMLAINPKDGHREPFVSRDITRIIGRLLLRGISIRPNSFILWEMD